MEAAAQHLARLPRPAEAVQNQAPLEPEPRAEVLLQGAHLARLEQAFRPAELPVEEREVLGPARRAKAEERAPPRPEALQAWRARQNALVVGRRPALVSVVVRALEPG